MTKQIGTGGAKILPNTFYVEEKNPVIETPLSCATSIMELELQSWGNKIRVFPAMPKEWKEASFDNLRAMGGFLVSGYRNEGKTEWVAIKSEVGEPCILNVPGWSSAKQVNGGKRIRITKISDGEFKINLRKGEKIILAPKKVKGPFIMVPTKHKTSEINLNGVKKGMNIKHGFNLSVTIPNPPR